MNDRRREAIFAAARSIADATDATVPVPPPTSGQHVVFDMANVWLEDHVSHLRPGSQIPEWAAASEQEIHRVAARDPGFVAAVLPWFHRWYDTPVSQRPPMLNTFAYHLAHTVRNDRLLRTSAFGQFLHECVGSLLRRRRAFHTFYLDEAPAVRAARIGGLRLREEIPALELLTMDLFWHWRDRIQLMAAQAQFSRITLFRAITLVGAAAEWGLRSGLQSLEAGSEQAYQGAQQHLAFAPLARWTMSRWEAARQGRKGGSNRVLLEVDLPVRSLWVPSAADPVAFIASPVPPRPARPDMALITAEETWRLVGLTPLA